MVKRFNVNSKMKDVLNNPVGHDLITAMIRQQNLKKSFFLNPLIKNAKLSQLAQLTKGVLDDAFVKTLCEKLNTYANERVIQSDKKNETWWKEAVIYQIYPRSFKDSDGDGIGDLNGILSKLDYLQQLGITMIWLSPIYDSPNDDNGYDVRDYKKIMQEFGTMEDFDRLLSEIHAHGMKLMLDMVINHTSDEHQWFREAIENTDSSQRDYYYFRKGKGEGEPPNNWTSFFFEKAWDYDENSGEWYLHLFSKKQPDLNWENPNLRHELYQILNWWLEKGVDGFRLDVINLISKPEGLPDGDRVIGEISGHLGIEHYIFGPKIHQYLREMNLNAFGKYDVVTIGETMALGLEMSKYFADESRKELNMVFNFDHLDMPGKDRYLDDSDYDLNYLKDYMIEWQTKYGKSCQQAIVLNNHDNPRMISKISKDLFFRDALAKMLAMMQMTLSGTPFIYQGEEIGMSNSVFENLEDFRDVEALNRYEKYKGIYSEEELMDQLRNGTRDHARVPMQWDASMQAGFTSGEPWIGVNPDYIHTNVAENIQNEDSILHFYQKMIELRKHTKALVYGDFIPVKRHMKDRFMYYKVYHGEKYYIELNLSDKKIVKAQLKDTHKLICSNYDYHNSKVFLPYEANLMQIIEN